MGLQKVAFNFMVERGGKLAKSLLCTKPQKAVTSIKGLKYKPLTTDTVQIAKKEVAEINAKADDLMQKVRKSFRADYVESNFPDVVKNVEKGHIPTYEEKNYLDYRIIENFKKENPEAFVFFGGERLSAQNYQFIMIKYGGFPIEIAKDSQITQIKQLFKEIDVFAKKNEFEPTFFHYMNALIMKKYNPKTYDYIINSNNPRAIGMFESWGARGNYDKIPSPSFFSNITPEQLQTMTTDCLPPSATISDYVACSDKYLDKTNSAVKELSEDLSKCKLSTDIKLYRGEKTVGMFDSVAIDKDFAKQLRQLLEANKDKAKNMRVSKYTGMYSTGTSTSLYDFLASKETLSLADAMQLAKFGDEKLVNEIIKKIKTSKIIDKRFKSLSFDKGMAGGWMSQNTGDNTTIIQNATIKQGTQGGFHNGSNAQYEVILNNTPKEITFPEVVYHKDGDYFELGSIIQNV